VQIGTVWLPDLISLPCDWLQRHHQVMSEH